jgi:hypothetical protein
MSDYDGLDRERCAFCHFRMEGPPYKRFPTSKGTTIRLHEECYQKLKNGEDERYHFDEWGVLQEREKPS